MTLNVDITNIEGWEQHCLVKIPEGEEINYNRLRPDKDHYYNPVTESLVFLGMPCGFNEITEKNYRQVARRISTYESTFGPFLFAPSGRHLPITEDQVKLHIGLRTNCSRMTETEFKKNLAQRAIEELQRAQRRQREEAEGEAKAARKGPGEREDVDYEETYYQVERELRAAGYGVEKLDEDLDDGGESANEFLERVHDGEDAVQLASEYGFIE